MTISYQEVFEGDGSNLPSRFQHPPREQVGIDAQRTRLEALYKKRPDYIGTPANDNQAWPLAQWLRKDGNEVLLAVAERYRAIYDAACSDVQLMGTSLGGDNIYTLDRDSRVNSDGSVEFKGVRKARPSKERQDKGPNESKKPVTFTPRSPTPTRRAWNGDELLNAAIDSRRFLRRLQDALGPLLEPFEDAVLHGETLRAIGEARGIGQHAPGAGRVLAMMGLEVVQRELRLIDREISQ